MRLQLTPSSPAGAKPEGAKAAALGTPQKRPNPVGMAEPPQALAASKSKTLTEDNAMAILLSPEIRSLLDAPNFAHLATLMPDGSPQSVPVWIGREGDRVLICTGESSLKAKNTQRDPRLSLSIVDFHNPYEEAQLRGRVIERRPDSNFHYIDAASHKYTGKPFPFRNPEGRVALVIEIEKARYTKLPFKHTPPA